MKKNNLIALDQDDAAEHISNVLAHNLERQMDRALYEIQLEEICKKLGISLDEKPIEDRTCSGYIERTKNDYRIIVKSDDVIVRKRFTIAHEIAHLIYHKDYLDHIGSIDRSTEKLTYDDGYREAQANAGAAKIIIPSPLVDTYMWEVGAPHNNKTLRHMARAFNVSEMSLAIAIGEKRLL